MVVIFVELDYCWGMFMLHLGVLHLLFAHVQCILHPIIGHVFKKFQLILHSCERGRTFLLPFFKVME